MSNKLLLKLVFIFVGFCLIVLGVSNFSRYKLIEKSEEHILMARYNDAIKCLEDARSSLVAKASTLVFGEDPFINYNLGVIYSLLGNYNKSAVQYRKVAKAKYPLLKAYAIYNNANIYATEMDFQAAADEYVKALKIDSEDFQIKKNLERMRLGQQQFERLFSKTEQEREERFEALKLIPWGNKYRYSGGQKIRW